MLTIIYAALAGLSIVFTAEVANKVKAKPGSWTAEMAEYQCRQTRLAPHVGKNDPCSATAKAIAAVPK